MTPAAHPSPSIAAAPRIGANWPEQGGIYAGLARCADGDYHLIAAPADGGENESVEWGGYGKSEPIARSDTDGPANTLALVASETAHPAAAWARGLSLNGHTDWYLPSRRELRVLWANVPELFEDAWYWSSTQYSTRLAWCQHFDDGLQNYDAKDYELRARAVRRFKAE